jgi:D-arabinono-1,4-lactone oxidase/Protein of unknown function (DUF3892)
MVCKSQNFVGVHNTNMPISNWNGDVQFTASQYWEPAHESPSEPPTGLANLVHAVAMATEQDKRLMTMGSTWAFENLIRSDDWEISLRQLTRQLFYVTGFAGQALTDSWRQLQFDRNGTRRLVHVEAGIEIGALSDLLMENPGEAWSMPVLGGANKQSLAGAISTSTHGGDWQQPPLPDLVRSIHLVTDGGREIWIERASDPITQDGRLRPVLPCGDTEIVRDDEIFNSALVSVGRFGVIYSFILEVTKAFNVAEVVTLVEREAVLTALAAGTQPSDSQTPLKSLFALLAGPGLPASIEVSGEVSGDPRFCQLIFNSQDTRMCWAQRRWATTNSTPLNVPGEPSSFFPLEVMFALAIANLSWGVGANAAWIVEQAIGPAFADAMSKGRRGPYHLLTSGTRASSQQPPQAESIEVIFASSDPHFVTFLRAVLYEAANYKQAGYISIRPCAASRATLSMHNVNATHAYSVEVSTLKGVPDALTWMHFVHYQAMQFGGRPHWGQYNKLDASAVNWLYGKSLRRWHRALWHLTRDSGRFSSDFARARGLDPESVRVVKGVYRTAEGALTHLVGPAGAAWSPVSARDVITDIRGSKALYAIETDRQIAFIVVVNNPKVGGAYLRTEADGDGVDNLASLPLATGPSPALADDAVVENLDCPLSVETGQSGSATVTMLNTGTSIWERANCVLAPTAGATIRFAPIPLNERTSPYQQASFVVPIAGGVSGMRGTLKCRLEKDGRQFGDASIEQIVVFTAVGEPADCADLRNQIAELERQIARLTDELDPDGDPRAQAQIRAAILRLRQQIATLRTKGTQLGCTLA